MGQSAPYRFDKAFVSLAALGLRRRARGVWKRRCMGQPEADEEGESFIGDSGMSFQTFDRARHAIKAFGKRGFKSVGAIGRQKRLQCRFDDLGARHAFGNGEIV